MPTNNPQKREMPDAPAPTPQDNTAAPRDRRVIKPSWETSAPDDIWPTHAPDTD
jgi:hypothetical protein